MSYIRLEKGADGVVELIFDQEGKAVNVMGEEYAEAMPKALDELEAMGDQLKGLYIRSGKPGQFFAGGDISMMLAMDLNPSREKREEMYTGLLEAKEPLARIERLGVPVVVGINGPALGGGYEIALACHHRVALDSARVKIGLPEAMLGLMPGAGGVVRLVRLLGMQEALTLSIGNGCPGSNRNFSSLKRLDQLILFSPDYMADGVGNGIRCHSCSEIPNISPGGLVVFDGINSPVVGLTFLQGARIEYVGGLPALECG